MASYQEKSDEELIPLVFSNPDIFLILMKRYERRLLVYVRRLTLCGQEDAEDIVQETFIKAYENLASFAAPLHFSAWLYRIAHNQAVSFLRRHTRRPQMAEWESDDGELLIDRMVSDTNVHAEIERRLKAEQIRHILSCLEEKYRTVLVLRYLEERDYKEIADILRLPMGTVATLLNRAKIRFRSLAESEDI